MKILLFVSFSMGAHCGSELPGCGTCPAKRIAVVDAEVSYPAYEGGTSVFLRGVSKDQLVQTKPMVEQIHFSTTDHNNPYVDTDKVLCERPIEMIPDPQTSEALWERPRATPKRGPAPEHHQQTLEAKTRKSDLKARLAEDGLKARFAEDTSTVNPSSRASTLSSLSQPARSHSEWSLALTSRNGDETRRHEPEDCGQMGFRAEEEEEEESGLALAAPQPSEARPATPEPACDKLRRFQGKWVLSGGGFSSGDYGLFMADTGSVTSRQGPNSYDYGMGMRIQEITQEGLRLTIKNVGTDHAMTLSVGGGPTKTTGLDGKSVVVDAKLDGEVLVMQFKRKNRDAPDALKTFRRFVDGQRMVVEVEIQDKKMASRVFVQKS